MKKIFTNKDTLKNLLLIRKCFKLVCGAGNEDAEEVEKLVFLYSKAGARYFDLSAKEDVVMAAYEGVKRANLPYNVFFNVSLGIKGDPHVSKAFINREMCVSCGKCFKSCAIQHAIVKGESYKVDIKRCIGCGFCIKTCPVKAIVIKSDPKPISKVLPPLIKLGLDSIELHAVTEDEDGAYRQWSDIKKVFTGMLSLCIDRSRLSDKKLLDRISRFIRGRANYSVIVQADGAPMSGCDDNPATTLQSLATAQIVDRANLPVFLMLSGGTNSQTARLAKLFSINAHGVALGSYARKIVSTHIDKKKFLSDKEEINKALEIARNLVKNTIRFM